MSSLVVVVPGDLATRTGGYGYDRRMIDGLRAQGWQVDVVRLDGSFPFPTLDARRQATEALAAIADRSLVMVDGLALGAMPDEAERERHRLRFVALVHHPLAYETGLEPDTAAAFALSERRALAAARAVITTSRATATSLADFGVAQDRVSVVEPGTDRGRLARGSGSDSCALLCVASFTPRKGHAVLVDALARLSGLSWHLTCAGDTARNPTFDHLGLQIDRSGLSGRVTFVDKLGPEALAAQYDRTDVFVLPTLYEGFGMVVAEALVRGLPVVSTPTGAIPDLVGEAAGILVPPGDPEALKTALARVILDRDLRAELAAGARNAAASIPDWDQAVGRMAATLRDIDR